MLFLFIISDSFIQTEARSRTFKSQMFIIGGIELPYIEFQMDPVRLEIVEELLRA